MKLRIRRKAKTERWSAKAMVLALVSSFFLDSCLGESAIKHFSYEVNHSKRLKSDSQNFEKFDSLGRDRIG